MPTSTRIHALLAKERALIFPGVYDALGAKLVERAGFPLTFISGYSVAATQLGLQLVVCPLTALYASAKAMQEMFGLIKSAGTTRSALERLLPFQQFHDTIGLDAYYDLDARYRPSETLEDD